MWRSLYAVWVALVFGFVPRLVPSVALQLSFGQVGGKIERLAVELGRTTIVSFKHYQNTTTTVCTRLGSSRSMRDAIFNILNVNGMMSILDQRVDNVEMVAEEAHMVPRQPKFHLYGKFKTHGDCFSNTQPPGGTSNNSCFKLQARQGHGGGGIKATYGRGQTSQNVGRHFIYGK